MVAHQAPPSLGFSRQEHWSGLPFSSPMHESEKWKWSRSVMSDPQRPHGLQPSRLLCPWDFPGESTGVGAIAFSVTFTKYLLKNLAHSKFLLSTRWIEWKEAMMLGDIEAMRVTGFKKEAKKLPRDTVSEGVTKEIGLGLSWESRTWIGGRRKDQFKPGADH